MRFFLIVSHKELLIQLRSRYLTLQFNKYSEIVFIFDSSNSGYIGKLKILFESRSVTGSPVAGVYIVFYNQIENE